jgi:hypothetical protein
MQNGKQRNLGTIEQKKKLYISTLNACVFTQVDMASEFKIKHNSLGGDYH